jgi:arylsulfatase A-like enzyme
MKRTLAVFYVLFIACFASYSQNTHRPNILWISCEDMSPHLSFYGDSTISTPHLDKLAREGVVYTNVYATAGVCSPSRSALITGMNQATIGGQHMRTLNNTFPEKTGLPKSYSIVPPAYVKAFPEYLRAHGYYCSNNVKTDYQFEAPPTVWDESSNKATWRNRKPGQPFFAVFNFTVTHESQVWVRKDLPLHADPAKIKVPPYYPNTDTVRKDMARFYSNIVDMDRMVGDLLRQLDEDGLADSTIIFFWSDHGDGLPFAKRELYDRGLRIPLVVRFPGKRHAGTRNDDLLSTIDFAPTVLSLAKIKPPSYMQGKAFLGLYKDARPNKYIYAARDRMDSEYDRVRAVRDMRFKYIRNFRPELPLYQNIEYRLNMDMMRQLLRLRDEGKLDSVQMKWFVSHKPKEELYDTRNDTSELHNLAGDPNYQQQLLEMRAAMDEWLSTHKDYGAIPEKEMIKQMWNGQDHPPVTAEVVIAKRGDKVVLSSATEGASIGYKIFARGESGKGSWRVYTEPFAVAAGDTLQVIAQRIGYEPTGVKTKRF